MKIKNLSVPVFFSALILIGWSFYSYQRASVVECKTTAIYATQKINRSELDALRFNILGIIGTDHFGQRNLQKNSLLINADDASLTMVSQIRIAALDSETGIEKIRDYLRSALEKISLIYGFPLRNSSIICLSPPKWYRLYSPSFLLTVLIGYFIIIKKKTMSPGRP